MTDPTAQPPENKEPRPPSFRQAHAIVGDIRDKALALKRAAFKDETPDSLIHIFAQLKRLKAVLQGLEKAAAAEKSIEEG